MKSAINSREVPGTVPPAKSKGWGNLSNSRRFVFLELLCLGDCYAHIHQLVQKGRQRPPYCVGLNQFPFHFHVILAGTIV